MGVDRTRRQTLTKFEPYRSTIRRTPTIKLRHSGYSHHVHSNSNSKGRRCKSCGRMSPKGSYFLSWKCHHNSRGCCNSEYLHLYCIYCMWFQAIALSLSLSLSLSLLCIYRYLSMYPLSSEGADLQGWPILFLSRIILSFNDGSCQPKHWAWQPEPTMQQASSPALLPRQHWITWPIQWDSASSLCSRHSTAQVVPNLSVPSVCVWSPILLPPVWLYSGTVCACGSESACIYMTWTLQGSAYTGRRWSASTNTQPSITTTQAILTSTHNRKCTLIAIIAYS